MTTTSVTVDEYFPVDDGEFRSDAITVVLTIEYMDENRWQISNVHSPQWSTSEPFTMRMVEAKPGLRTDVMVAIMTSHSWCEHISEHIASEMKQDRNLERPALFNQYVFT